MDFKRKQGFVTMRMSRRQLMTTAAAIVASPRLAEAYAQPPERPNIVWIVVHDVHAPLIGCYGNALAKTPSIDSLSRDGVRYTNAFSTTPVCAPSRFAMITGAYPAACAPAQHQRAEAQLPDTVRPLPLHMRAAGYYCTNNVFTDYNTNADEGAFWDDCDIKAHWRNRPSGKPFFSVYNYLITHETNIFRRGPTQADQAKVDIPPFLPDRPEIREVLARNVDIVNQQDIAVAHVLQELADDNLADDTFVFFLADHGGVHPRSKRYCYDDGLRVPLLVRVPAKWRHLAKSTIGQQNDELVSHVDLAPTVLALAGVPIPETMTGRAFLGPHLLPKRDYAFSMRDRMDERYDLIHTVRDKQYRYIRNYNPQQILGEHQAYEWQSVAYQAWERAHLAGELNDVQGQFWRPKLVEELYDTYADPREIANVASDPARQVDLKRLRSALDAHLIAINDNSLIPEDSPGTGYDASRAPGANPLPAVIAAANLALEQDARNRPRLLRGLEHANATVRFWSAQGLVHVPLPDDARKTVVLRLGTETDANVRCILAEALAGAGQFGRAVQALVTILQQDAPEKAKLRALNVLTVLPREHILAARDVVAAYAAMPDGNFASAGKYLLLKLDAQYRPDSRTVGPVKVKMDRHHPIGNPQI